MMGSIDNPETSVSNHLTPRNTPYDGETSVDRGGSLNSHFHNVYKKRGTIFVIYFQNFILEMRHFYRDEVTREWRRLHNEELYALYSSPNIIREIKSRRLRWAGHVARMGERRGAYRALVGKHEGRRPLGRPRRRWEDNIKMDLREVGCGSADWVDLAQDRDRWRAFVYTVMNLRFHKMRGIP
jgi:hypothetical protein